MAMQQMQGGGMGGMGGMQGMGGFPGMYGMGNMGQQQLLLLVLTIVIVGMAVLIGIQAFSQNQKKANIDALTNLINKDVACVVSLD